MIFDDLKKANMQAMKDKNADAKSVYSVLISKCMLKSVELKPQGKELTDADTLQIISKMVKELEEELNGFKAAGRDEKVKELEYQRSLLLSYLPKMLTADEIKAEISKLEDKSIKAVMQHFKNNFPGQCDMKLVSSIAKEFN